jgi:aryl-alcohol dehydrogenase-like predicted oxidoreductase
MTNLSLPGTDLRISPVCFGTADWGSRASPEDAERLYTAFRAAGGNCFDSAHCYAFWADKLGTPETLLGQFARKHDKRQDVVICTKGCHITGGPKYERPPRYMTPELLRQDLDDSLERLGTDYIDLYYLHRDDPAVPVDEIIDALNEHQRAGRIRYFAASNWRGERIRQAHDYAKRRGIKSFAASQILWNLAHLSRPMPPDICAMDDTELAFYERTRLPVFAFTPSGNGYFSGRGNTPYENDVSHARRERCRQLAKEQGATPVQIAIAYLMRHSFPGIPITGTCNVEHLNEIVGATKVTLTPEQVRWLKNG